jgi:pantoate--beta-alanine ligase
MTGGVSVVRGLGPLRSEVRAWREAGDGVALVPTMGALHRGHLELVRLANAHCRRVVVSIFVNPAQFAPHEDFERYPRDEAGDLAKLKDVGCDLVWAPDRAEMYPLDFATRVVPGGAAEGLESDFRPQFFTGVATVCCKLFTQVAPDIAVFGEKDYQQLCVVRQMVRDLDLPLKIVGAETVREADGLAMSSPTFPPRSAAPRSCSTTSSRPLRARCRSAAAPSISPLPTDGWRWSLPASRWITWRCAMPRRCGPRDPRRSARCGCWWRLGSARRG